MVQNTLIMIKISSILSFQPLDSTQGDYQSSMETFSFWDPPESSRCCKQRGPEHLRTKILWELQLLGRRVIRDLFAFTRSRGVLIFSLLLINWQALTKIIFIYRKNIDLFICSVWEVFKLLIFACLRGALVTSQKKWVRNRSSGVASSNHPELAINLHYVCQE